MGILDSINRWRWISKPIPESWKEILANWFPPYTNIPDDELERFHNHLKFFLWGRYWIGAGGLEVTEEMKVVISASAARIARNLDYNVYDRLTEIVIYPDSYKHPENDDTEVLGEAHHWGTVVFSWDAVRHGVCVSNDGHDTAVHEFAHVLDVADGWFDGTPQLHSRRDYHDWSRVMGEHFIQLQEHKMRHGVLRRYGATNEAEFFAVATEAFFEKPTKLKRHAPELFEEFVRFYQLDPIEERKKYAKRDGTSDNG